MKKNDNFILEDQSWSFKYSKNSSDLNIVFNRVAFIFFICLIIFFVFSAKIFYLSKLDLPKKINVKEDYDFRSSILDRDNNIIAKSVITKNIGINPNEVIDKDKLLINLKIIFPNKNFKNISKKLNGDKFFYVEKTIDNKKYNKLFLLGDKSIKVERKLSRIYPQENLFSHVIGQIDDNNNGISGVEKYYDYELKSSTENLYLSLDSNIQHLIRLELIKFQNIFNYVGSAAILMDVENGEILSLVSLPDFNLNERQDISDKKYINRATKALYEFGSVFKTFTFAAGLDFNVIQNDTEFLDLKKKIVCGKNSIGEYDNDIPTNLSAEDILIRSGNIGSVRIGQKVGIKNYKNFLKKIGILDRIEFDIEEVSNPLPINWGKCKLATSSFGHGITTTLLQLAKGYAIISNGGYNVNPTIIKNQNDNQKKEKILKNSTSLNVIKILRKIVSTKEGTAGFANIPGYEVGGKTGTAQKSINGKYSDFKINTFVSVFPASKPKYVFLVLLDEPKANKEYIYNYRDGSEFRYKGNLRNTAGWTTVEVAGKIIEKIGPILATKY